MITKISETAQTVMAGIGGVTLSSLNILHVQAPTMYQEWHDSIGIVGDFALVMVSLAMFTWLITQTIDRGQLIRARMRKRSESKRIINKHYEAHKKHKKNVL